MVFIQPEAQKFLDLNRDAPQLDRRTPEENRAAQQKTAAAWGKKTRMASVYETSVRGVTVRVYIPEEPALADAPPAEPAFIFFHGGGWVLGGFRDHGYNRAGYCRRIGNYVYQCALSSCTGTPLPGTVG
ncbi:hypothetical protein [Corynebacterium sp. KPL2838]|uniref:hypothetical protein n=1 Tax=Corynebacterium sp. KPL2838 TaxID=3158316 RepID=UPI0032EE1B1B